MYALVLNITQPDIHGFIGAPAVLQCGPVMRAEACAVSISYADVLLGPKYAAEPAYDVGMWA